MEKLLTPEEKRQKRNKQALDRYYANPEKYRLTRYLWWHKNKDNPEFREKLRKNYAKITGTNVFTCKKCGSWATSKDPEQKLCKKCRPHADRKAYARKYYQEHKEYFKNYREEYKKYAK